MGEHLSERFDGVAHGGGVDDHVGVEVVYLVGRGEAAGVECEPKPLRIGVDDGHFVVKRKQVAEERSHLAGSYDQYLHGWG